MSVLVQFINGNIVYKDRKYFRQKGAGWARIDEFFPEDKVSSVDITIIGFKILNGKQFEKKGSNHLTI